MILAYNNRYPQLMSKLTLNYRSLKKEIYLQNQVTTNQLSKLFQSVFHIKEEILGIKDQFGKFYDLNYASKNINTLDGHIFSIVTTKDAADNISFGNRKSLKNSLIQSQPEKCLGIVSDVERFKRICPDGIIILLTLKEDDVVPEIPFYYYLRKGTKRRLTIWSDRSVVLECELGKEWEQIIKIVNNYLQRNQQPQKINTDDQNCLSNIDMKRGMIIEAFEELYRDGIITELDFYKRKIIIFERPDVYIKRYINGETVDRNILFDIIREDIARTKQEARILSRMSSKDKIQIPILVRKSTNVIQKVTTQHSLSAEQQQILNLLLQLQLKGLITETEMQAYQKHLLAKNHQLIESYRQYIQIQTDQIMFTKKLRKLFREKKEEKKLILS